MELRELICDVCHKMWQKGWVAANDGNVSVKLEDGTFLATPTGMSKSFITPEKLVHIDKEGNILEAEDCCRPSSEIKMHLRCYQEREDVGAVLHAHPPVATGFAVANKALDEYSMIETVIALGSVPVTPYGTPSTYEVPEAIAPYLGGTRRCASAESWSTDSGGGCDHRLLSDGNPGTFCADQFECASAWRSKGNLSGKYRQTDLHEKGIWRDRKTSRI